jgi:hypothetical protein
VFQIVEHLNHLWRILVCEARILRNKLNARFGIRLRGAIGHIDILPALKGGDSYGVQHKAY